MGNDREVKKSSGWVRLIAFFSVLWVMFVWYKTPTIGGHFFIKDFVKLGIAPVVILWGIVWVVHGFRR